MITATATLQQTITATAALVGKQVGSCDDATVTNQAGDYSLTIPSGNTDKLQFGKVKDKDGNDVQVDYIPAADGYIFEETPCPATPSLELTVNDTTPDYGDTITLTAVAAGITANNYLFFARQNDELTFIGDDTDGVLNWTVNLIGEFDVFVQADDGTSGSFNVGGDSVTSTPPGTITTDIQLWLDPELSGIVPPDYPDISGFSRDGTLINSPTVVTGAGGYVELNGVNQYVGNIGSVSDFSFIQNTMIFTMSAWYYVDNLTARNPIVGNTTASSEKGFILYGLDTSVVGYGITKAIALTISIGSSGESYQIVSEDNIITSTGWNHVTVTMNGIGTCQFYLNGVAITTLTENAGTPSGTSSGNSSRLLNFGKPTNASTYFNGRIGPIQIYDRALTPAEVVVNYETNKSDYGH